MLYFGFSMQGYEKANATQTTMYQVRWGADYLMKLVGAGTGNSSTVTYLELIYQVQTHLLFFATLCCWSGQALMVLLRVCWRPSLSPCWS